MKPLSLYKTTKHLITLNCNLLKTCQNSRKKKLKNTQKLNEMIL